MNENQAIIEAALNNRFAPIIGQIEIKRELTYRLDNYLATKRVPHFLIHGPKGNGKTTLAEEIAKSLFLIGENGQPIVGLNAKGALSVKKKPLLEINASSIKNLTQFVQGYLVKHVVDKDITVFVDEASELPNDVQMALLSMLEDKNSNGKTSYTHDDYTVDLNFTKQTFIFATSEAHKLFHALKDRCKPIALQPYTLPELGQIVQAKASTVKFVDNVLEDISNVLRGNARAAKNMAIDIVSTGKQLFGKSEWKEFCYNLNILPLGLNAIELEVLRFLDGNLSGLSLTNLSAKTGMSKDSLRLDSENYLMKQSLLEVTTGGRVLTAKGQNYLKNLNTIRHPQTGIACNTSYVQEIL